MHDIASTSRHYCLAVQHQLAVAWLATAYDDLLATNFNFSRHFANINDIDDVPHHFHISVYIASAIKCRDLIFAIWKNDIWHCINSHVLQFDEQRDCL